MIDTLNNAGYHEAGSPDEAEIIIINSCSFIEPARQETVNVTLETVSAWPDKIVIMAGCFSQRYPDKTNDLIPELDGIFGNYNPAAITELIEMIKEGRGKILIPEKPASSFSHKRSILFPRSIYIKLSEGCRHRCSFCAIPHIRGSLRSRTIEDVCSEIGDRVKEGYFEFNLVAQDLASFGNDRGKNDLIPLLNRLEKLKGDFWIRFLYIHPDNFPEEILDICKRDPRFLAYFDIPFQHASPAVLKKMGRTGTAEKYLGLVGRIREKLPSAAIRTSFLTGFPGESSRDFKMLRDFQEKARIDWAGVFCYSREENTPAWKMGSSISFFLKKKIIRNRKKILEEKQQEITSERLKRFIGKKINAIIEEPVRNEMLYMARGYFQAPEVDGLIVAESENELKAGDLVTVEIEKITGVDCKGVVLDRFSRNSE